MANNLNVKTRYGTFNGFLDENSVRTWLGIPYAKPPVGKLRWQAPQPLKPSDKSFDAKNFGFMAVQLDDPLKDISNNPQSEDCLTLNIWAHGESKNKPVMVFIPGGGFVSGGSVESIYNGSNFVLAYDVIIVTINYRLNIFGFMNFASIDSAYEDSGYLGIEDQVAAVKWVRENIAAFGGNPDNITVFGHSAGSISVMLLTVAPAAKNLFQKAIPQSGHLVFYNTPENSTKIAERFMELSGTNRVSDLMKRSYDELKKLYEKLCGVHNNLADYMPTCDGKFLPRDPFKALKEGGARGIKFLTGTTAFEWCLWLFSDKNFFKTFRTNHEKTSLALQRYKGTYTPKEIYQTWLNNRPDTEENFIDYVNQLDWRVGQELAAEYQSKFEDVYYYLFSEPSTIENLRSCHEMDLPFTFNLPNHILPNPAPNLVKQVQASWAAFAATGNPNNEFIPHWERYTADNRQTMELNSKGCVCHKDLNTQNLNALRYVYEN
ncbi:MAG: carboxylesterase/lipase family protein [Selenomonadaceae bacterium]|nr:carboxylesterase/lipase family protein [Selenomonadaceae bacterium]